MADTSDFRHLDLSKFETFVGGSDSFLERSSKISEDFGNIVSSLLSNWKGEGADAFKEDADNVACNINGVTDILKTMCDTLKDCKTVFMETDQKLGRMNGGNV